jgi:SAM-dependent methyltransferase
MGTGGGELLSELTPLPADSHATESYQPNLAIAQKRLSPFSVKIHAFEKDAALPFDDEVYDLVINRHESFDLDEVFRILKPGGRFITQQVGGLDNLELNQTLETKLSFPFFNWGMESVLIKLYENKWAVEVAKKAALKTTFLDIGAVFYYLKAIPWQIKGFCLETHFEGLFRVHNIIENQGEFITTAHRFLIVAKKKGATP